MRDNVTENAVYGLPKEGEIVYQHPWKLSRESCVLKHLKHKNFHNIADIGVNDMFYTKKLQSLVDGQIYAVDVFFPDEGMIKDDIICINNIENLPENKLDCIVMMDVLEHIENDKPFFNKIVEKLKDTGTLLITVPAFQFLFSAHDTKSLHYRRYNRKQLLKLLEHSDIKIEKCYYFYSSLFFARLLFLFRKDKFTGNDIGWKHSEKHILTIIIKKILDIDFRINKLFDKIGIHFPGLSLIAVCRKKCEETVIVAVSNCHSAEMYKKTY